MDIKKVLKVMGLIALFLLFYRYFTLILIAGIVIYFVRRNKKEIPEPPKKRPRIEAERTDYIQVQATVAEARKVIDEHNDIVRNTDLRQFRGRTDVTREELATYMFEQQYWNGAYERRVMMEEITKYCNLTMDDVEWCIENLNHYKTHPNNPMEYTSCAVRSEEQRAIWEENNRIGREDTYKTIRDLNKLHSDTLRFEDDLNIPKTDAFYKMRDDLNEQHNQRIQELKERLREYDYDEWLKMKGYAK